MTRKKIEKKEGNMDEEKPKRRRRKKPSLLPYRQNTIYLCRGHTAVIWIHTVAGGGQLTIRRSSLPQCLHNTRSLTVLLNRNYRLFIDSSNIIRRSEAEHISC